MVALRELKLQQAIEFLKKVCLIRHQLLSPKNIWKMRFVLNSIRLILNIIQQLTTKLKMSY
ncbi:hypothetical protein EAH77_15230 [Ewingella americana]|uniref:Uncharacterized protein n=1 Tax=Ewingella americana TaxID=41202 RepID=A0A502GCC4_9GAMM|nr:hypothetical protein EAH77_15230 [Ewingella americana]